MTVLAGPFTIAACLLVVAGIAKAAQPASTSGALAALRLPSRRWMVRAGGIAEALLAVTALATAEPVLALLVALSYVGFAGFVVAALRAGTPLSSCGCLGKVDTPPHPVHVGLDLAAAAAAIGVAVQGGVSIGDVLADQPWAGIPFLLLVVIGAGAAAVAMSSLPRTLALTGGRRS